MRYYKILYLLLFVQGALFSQQLQYDEIKKLISATPDNADSLFFLHKQLLGEIKRLNKGDLELVNCNLNLAEYCFRLGNMPEAANYATEATLIAETKNVKEKLARCYYYKARVFNAEGKHKEALAYFKKGLSFAEKKKEQAILYGQIGFVFTKLKQFDSSLYYQNKALQINMDSKDTLGIASCYSNIGYVYGLNGKPNLTRDYYYRAAELRKNSKDIFLRAASLIDCASMEQEAGNSTRCIGVVRQALAVIRNAKYFSLEANCYQSMAYSFEELKKWDSAYYYHKLFKAVSDSVYNQENMRASLKVETKYQLSSKENEISLLTEKNKNGELVMMRERMIRWVFVGGIILLIVILFMVFRQLKIRKEAYAKINEQKEIIEEKNKEIIDSIHYAKRIQTALMSSEKNIEVTINRMKN
jgi:tetratricopeptide (TPR) repeat protein